MADYSFGVVPQSVAGNASAEETVTLGLDFWTISTAVNILTAGTSGGSATTQAALNKLIQIISLNGQPVILNNPTGTGPYVLTFAIEHPGSWTAGTYSAGVTAPTSGPMSLVAAIQIHGINYGFYTDSSLTATLTSELMNNS